MTVPAPHSPRTSGLTLPPKPEAGSPACAVWTSVGASRGERPRRLPGPAPETPAGACPLLPSPRAPAHHEALPTVNREASLPALSSHPTARDRGLSPGPRPSLLNGRLTVTAVASPPLRMLRGVGVFPGAGGNPVSPLKPSIGLSVCNTPYKALRGGLSP